MKVCNERGYDCLGLDISRYAISRVGKKVFGAILGDIQTALPLRSNSLDIVIMLDVIEHLDRPSTAIEEIRKVLKPNGWLYLATPNLTAITRLLKGRKWYGFLDKSHVSLFTPFSLQKLLQEHNFEILRCYTPFDFPLFRKLINMILGRTYAGGQIRLIAENRTAINGAHYVDIIKE